MPKDIANLDESVLETLRRHDVSPVDHFAKVATGRTPCLLCHGEGEVSELVFNMHCQKAISFELAQRLDKESFGPCPDCYGRGYIYSNPDRQDRAYGVLLNQMPEKAPSSGPVVQRFHRADTIEAAYLLDKEMREASGEDDQDVIEGDFMISIEDDEAILEEMAKEEQLDNEVFWERPEPYEDDLFGAD